MSKIFQLKLKLRDTNSKLNKLRSDIKTNNSLTSRNNFLKSKKLADLTQENNYIRFQIENMSKQKNSYENKAKNKSGNSISNSKKIETKIEEKLFNLSRMTIIKKDNNMNNNNYIPNLKIIRPPSKLILVAKNVKKENDSGSHNINNNHIININNNVNHITEISNGKKGLLNSVKIDEEFNNINNEKSINTAREIINSLNNLKNDDKKNEINDTKEDNISGDRVKFTPPDKLANVNINIINNNSHNSRENVILISENKKLKGIKNSLIKKSKTLFNISTDLNPHLKSDKKKGKRDDDSTTIALNEKIKEINKYKEEIKLLKKQIKKTKSRRESNRHTFKSSKYLVKTELIKDLYPSTNKEGKKVQVSVKDSIDKDTLQLEIQNYKKKIEEKDLELNHIKNLLNSQNSERNKDGTNEHINTLIKDLGIKNNEIMKIKQHNKELNLKIKNLQSIIEKKEGEISKCKNSYKELLTKYNNLKQKMKDKEEDFNYKSIASPKKCDKNNFSFFQNSPNKNTIKAKNNDEININTNVNILKLDKISSEYEGNDGNNTYDNDEDIDLANDNSDYENSNVENYGSLEEDNNENCSSKEANSLSF